MKKNFYHAAEVKDLVPSTANEILTTNVHDISFRAPKKLFWPTLATGVAIGVVSYAICKDVLRKKTEVINPCGSEISCSHTKKKRKWKIQQYTLVIHV